VLIAQLDLSRRAVWTGDAPRIRGLLAAPVAFAHFNSPFRHDHEPSSHPTRTTPAANQTGGAMVGDQVAITYHAGHPQ
jgi:hypothetical protein